MRKEDYDKAVRLCARSIEKGFDLAPTHTAQEGLPFDATQSLRRQMFSRSALVDVPSERPTYLLSIVCLQAHILETEARAS